MWRNHIKCREAGHPSLTASISNSESAPVKGCLDVHGLMSPACQLLGPRVRCGQCLDGETKIANKQGSNIKLKYAQTVQFF